MKTIYNLAFLFSIVYILSSCAGAKKIDFNSAYKFGKYNYKKNVIEDLPNEQEAPSEEKLYTSREVIIEDQPEQSLSRIEENIYQKIGVSVEDGKSMKTDKLAERFKALDNKEKREIRRDIKAELKNLEAENTYSVNDINRTNELTEYMRLSIIIGSVGLILLLLGALFSVSFLSIVGALAIVGAAVLFILDQV